jgi:hypothetical protein
VKADIAQQLELELISRGFRREGNGLEAPGGSIGLADAYVRRAELGDLLEMAAAQRVTAQGQQRVDLTSLIDGLKTVIARYT